MINLMTSALPPIELTLFIAAPAARVWSAIITPADVVKYHLCPLASVDLRVGGSLVYGIDGQAFITGAIIESIPGQRLVHTFRFTPDTHGQVSATHESHVAYAIKPMGAMCQLTLTHDRFDPADVQSHANATGGWPTILSGLKTWLETGRPLPWPESPPR